MNTFSIPPVSIKNDEISLMNQQAWTAHKKYEAQMKHRNDNLRVNALKLKRMGLVVRQSEEPDGASKLHASRREYVRMRVLGCRGVREGEEAVPVCRLSAPVKTTGHIPKHGRIVAEIYAHLTAP